MRTLLTILILSIASITAHGQILFAESFSILLDTTKMIKGSITPGLKVQTQKALLIEFTNMADIAIKVKKNSLTFANKIEFNQLGSDVFLSGGYVYANFKENLSKHFSLEYFGQIHWAEVRGLQVRYAGGPIMRLKIIENPKTGLFFGTGPMYEFEEWNYNAVHAEKLPSDLTPIKRKLIKSSSYISYKHSLSARTFVDLSVYHQATYDGFSTPRLASSSRFTYALTEHLQVIAMYQNIYDYKPVVPIDNWFHRFIMTIGLSF